LRHWQEQLLRAANGRGSRYLRKGNANIIFFPPTDYGVSPQLQELNLVAGSEYNGQWFSADEAKVDGGPHLHVLQ
jgi:hypothetical protein